MRGAEDDGLPAVLWEACPNWTSQGHAEDEEAKEEAKQEEKENPFWFGSFMQYPSKYARLIRVTKGAMAALHNSTDDVPWLLSSTYGIMLEHWCDDKTDHFHIFASARD